MTMSSHDVEGVIYQKTDEELSRLVVAVALNEEDFAFAEAVCLRLAKSKDETVRGNAILGFGHIARRAKALKEEKRARELIEAGLRDESGYVRGQAVSASDDVTFFITR